MTPKNGNPGSLTPDNVANLVRLSGSGNYTDLHFRDGSKRLVAYTLRDFEQVLTGLLRIHKSHSVRPEQVRVCRQSGHQQWEIEMQDGAVLPVSKRRIHGVTKTLKALRP